TAPLSLTDAIEYLLRPLKVIKFPVHEIALMLSIALRFVPTLMDETEKIMNAQRARGVDFGEGNVFQQMKSIVPLLVPLFVSSFNRAEELATAMEARGYQGGEGRTKYRLLKWELTDSTVIIAYAIVTVALVYLRS
ncbi:MAG: energy-coupling factor transporter transmembrane component T, partial [Carnobacterium maltaromaticum]